MKPAPVKICCNCRHYLLPLTDADWLDGGGLSVAACGYYKKPFPNPFGWANDDGSVPPGMRSCERWQDADAA